MRKIWVVTAAEAGYRLLSAAHSLADHTEYHVEAAMFHAGELPAFQAGAEHVYRISGAGDEQGKAIALRMLAVREKPDVLLFPSTAEYRAVAPMLAAMLQTGLTADCIGLGLEPNGILRQTRPAFGGSMDVDVFCESARPQIATVQECALPPAKKWFSSPGTTSREAFAADSIVQTLSRIPCGEQGCPLQSARVIFAGGKGVGSKAGFGKLRQLASLVPGSAVGASRGAVSASLAPYACQVGLTGEFVRPQLYVAFGISGAVQHLAGIKESGYIISVNQDQNAPIFECSDLAVVAPWEEVADTLIAALAASSRSGLVGRSCAGTMEL